MMKAFVRKTGYVGGTVYFANTMEEAVDYFRSRDIRNFERMINNYRHYHSECKGPPSTLRGYQLKIDGFLQQIEEYQSGERDEWYRDSIDCHEISNGVSIEVGDY